jgi:transcriptional regulator with XRE-family HTH domain
MQHLSYIYISNNVDVTFFIMSKHIGEILKNARLKKNLTQEQVAQLVGKKRSYISRIESEDGNNIKIHTLIDIVENGLGGSINIEF